jgi:hypothetical protein
MAIESRVLDLLDGWRDLPAYQLERRADVFFAAFLPRFLSHRFGTSVRDALIPEFPLHLRTLYPEIPRNGDDSCRLDYLALTDDLRHAYFIELKTDPRSRGKLQETNMDAAIAVGFRELVVGLLKIVKATPDKHKYCYLLRLLARHEVLTLPDDLEAALRSKRYKSAVDACLPSVHVRNVNPEIKLLYLEPNAHSDRDIGFAEFANWLDTLQDDDLALRFSASLKRWTASPAGRYYPQVYSGQV